MSEDYILNTNCFAGEMESKINLIESRISEVDTNSKQKIISQVINYSKQLCEVS